MEFLRFGSSIPGAYWGCCAADIIQNFKVDPKGKHAIEIVSGDGGGSTGRYVGDTWEECFRQRLAVGTFGSNKMPNHAFICILTEGQINSEPGKSWLKILRETGFEYIRSWDNSVWSGAGEASSAPQGHRASGCNHMFILVRNVGTTGVKDMFTPPAAWSALPKVVPEMADFITDKVALTKDVFAAQLPLWKKLPAVVYQTADALKNKGIDPTCAGVRSGNPHPNAYQFVESGGAPQELLTLREKRLAERAALRSKPLPANAFPAKAAQK